MGVGMTTQISMLGPMQVDCGQGPVQVGGRRQRAVLAMLALRVGHVVSTDFIIDGLWVDPPGGAVNTVQVYVSRLRGLHHPAVAGGGLLPIIRRGSGYLLEADPGTVDTAVFERRVQDGAAIVTTDPAHASDLLAACAGPVAR